VAQLPALESGLVAAAVVKIQSRGYGTRSPPDQRRTANLQTPRLRQCSGM